MTDTIAAALDEVERDMQGAAEKGGDFTDGAEWVAGRMRYALTPSATSKIDPDVRKALEEADHTIVAETDDYFIYSDGSLTPGYFGVRYSLRASALDGSRIHVAEASFSTNSAGEPTVNLGPSSMTFDPIVVRAKADILSRMADILAKAVAS